jgi:hypothetical protein
VLALEDFGAQLLGLLVAKLVAVDLVTYGSWLDRLLGVGACRQVGRDGRRRNARDIVRLSVSLADVCRSHSHSLSGSGVVRMMVVGLGVVALRHCVVVSVVVSDGVVVVAAVRRLGVVVRAEMPGMFAVEDRHKLREVVVAMLLCTVARWRSRAGRSEKPSRC